MRCPGSWLFVLVLLLGASAAPARADRFDDPDTSAARQRFERGLDAYNHEDFAVALKEFQAARVIKALPALDYNIGRCLDRLGRYAEAIAAYKTYLAANPSQAEAAEVKERVRVLGERIEVMDRSEGAPSAKAPRRPDDQRPAKRPIESPKETINPEPAPAAPRHAPAADSAVRRKVGIIVAVVGGAIGLAGGGLLIAGQIGAGSVNDATTVGDRNANADTVGKERLAGGIVLGVGGAALIAGLVTAVLPVHSETQSLYIAPNGLGLALGGSF